MASDWIPHGRGSTRARGARRGLIILEHGIYYIDYSWIIGGVRAARLRAVGQGDECEGGRGIRACCGGG